MSEQIARYRQDRDAFGHELLDFMNEGQGFEIIEREDGYIAASPNPARYFSEFSDWSEVEQRAMSYLVPGRALDVGCGAGRVSLYLQEQGYEVVGIDNSPLAIEVCRRRGVKDARLLSITQVGPQLGLFDTILMMGNNWGLMGSFKRARWLLRKFHRLTRPGARIIAESNDVYGTDNPLHLAYHAYNRERGRMGGQIRLRVCHKVYRSDWFDYLMVSEEEMQAILSGTGWRAVDFLRQEGAGSYIAIIEKVEG